MSARTDDHIITDESFEGDLQERLIVDRDITDNVIDGIYLTVQEAINAAHEKFLQDGERKTKIKIASNLYEESLYINVPGLVLEPKERGGEVTLQQSLKPCIIIDVGFGNSVTIKNTRMLLKGIELNSSSLKRY